LDQYDAQHCRTAASSQVTVSVVLVSLPSFALAAA